MMDTQDLQQQPLSVEEDLVAAAVYRLTLPPAPACHLPDQRLIVLSQILPLLTGNNEAASRS